MSCTKLHVETPYPGGAFQPSASRSEIVILFGISETDSTQIEKVSLFYCDEILEIGCVCQPAPLSSAALRRLADCLLSEQASLCSKNKTASIEHVRCEMGVCGAHSPRPRGASRSWTRRRCRAGTANGWCCSVRSWCWSAAPPSRRPSSSA